MMGQCRAEWTIWTLGSRVGIPGTVHGRRAVDSCVRPPHRAAGSSGDLPLRRSRHCEELAYLDRRVRRVVVRVAVEQLVDVFYRLALQDGVSTDVTTGLAGDRWQLGCLAEWAAWVYQGGAGLLHPRHPLPHGFLRLAWAAGHLLAGARRGLVQHQELLAHRRHLLIHTSGAPISAT